jgi:hypothetical protein
LVAVCQHYPSQNDHSGKALSSNSNNSADYLLNNSSFKSGNSGNSGLGIETDLSCSQSKKDIFFKTPSGKKYIVFEEKNLSDAEADKTYKSMLVNYPNVMDSNSGQWKKEETLLLQYFVFNNIM